MKITENKYIVNCTSRTFDESVKYCKSIGHVIASFHSDEDINEIKDELASKGYCSNVGAYIGATSDGNGNWKWMDRSAWWKYNENDGLVGSHETKIIWRNDGKWHDFHTGHTEAGVICQKGISKF